MGPWQTVPGGLQRERTELDKFGPWYAVVGRYACTWLHRSYDGKRRFPLYVSGNDLGDVEREPKSGPMASWTVGYRHGSGRSGELASVGAWRHRHHHRYGSAWQIHHQGRGRCSPHRNRERHGYVCGRGVSQGCLCGGIRH